MESVISDTPTMDSSHQPATLTQAVYARHAGRSGAIRHSLKTWQCTVIRAGLGRACLCVQSRQVLSKPTLSASRHRLSTSLSLNSLLEELTVSARRLVSHRNVQSGERRSLQGLFMNTDEVSACSHGSLSTVSHLRRDTAHRDASLLRVLTVLTAR